MRPFQRIRVIGGLAALVVSTAGLGGCTSTAARQEAELNSRRATSHLNLGIDQLVNGRSALALREFMTAESLDPRNPQIQYALGDAYMSLEKLEESERHYLKALELDPAHHDASLSLSGLYIWQKRFAEAIVACEALIDDPTFPRPWTALANRGWSELQLGRPAEARASLKLALDYNKDYVPAMLSLSELESNEGRRREAIDLLQAVIRLDPGDRVESEVNYRLAEQYIALGRRDLAVGHLTTAVARAPEGAWARRSEEYLKLLR